LYLLRAETKTKDILVVMLSADAMPHQMEQLRAAGAKDYLTKPLDVAQLLKLLNEKLNSTKIRGSQS